MNEYKFPVRINKYLSDKQICSRREADRLIEKGLVFVNGKKAKIGQKINKGDKVEIKGGAKKIKSKYKYFLFYKPEGIVSHKTNKGETEAREYAKLPKEFAPVGRLDKKSTGLMLLTNDGRIVDRLLNPKYKHEKEYIVVADKYIKNQDIKKLERGVNIEGYITLPARVKRLGNRKISITLQEGKKHQIRRMLAALGYQTVSLKRIRIDNLKLGNLKPGEKRELKGKELKTFLENLGIK